MTNKLTVEQILELADKLHPSGEWEYNELGSSIHSEGNYSYMVADVRGWGHLTGGGALNLSEDEATAIQDNTGRLIASLPHMVEIIREQQAEIAELKLFKEVYNECCDLIEPYVVRQGLNPKGTLPASLIESVQILIHRHAELTKCEGK